MKKSLSFILIFSISIFMLIGCGKTDKPTTAVNSYFSSLNSQNNSNIVKSVVESIVSSEDESTNKELSDSLNKALSKLKIEPQKETIDSNSAVVSVNIKGISLSSVRDSLLDDIQNSSQLSKLSNDDLSKKITEILIDKINNAEVEERKGQLSLTKEKDKWTLNTEDDNYFNTIWGATETQLKGLKH